MTQTREKLLDAAVGLMMDRGYEATGVEDICKAARVTKGSFFHYFDSKEALGKAAVERFYDIMKGKFAAAPQLKKEDPLDRLLAWTDVAASMTKDPLAQKGCLIGTFTQEISATHDVLRRACESCFADSTGFLKSELDAAVALHRPKEKIDTRSVADYMIATAQGALILAKARREGRAVVEAMGHLKRYLSGLFGR
jgi:TetR/AcrR family transcriptional regulator, transcriptional repressor for nem operon